MAKKKVHEVGIFEEQPLTIKNLYKEWEFLSKDITATKRYYKNNNVSLREKVLCELQCILSKALFKVLDKRILIEVLEK